MNQFPGEQLATQLKVSIENPFYKAHLASMGGVVPEVFTPSSWSEVPFLERSDITEAYFWDRVHTPLDKIECIRTTSGTSGSGILITPRSLYGTYDSYGGEIEDERRMSFIFHSFYDFPRTAFPTDMVMGDVLNIEASAVLAKKMKCNALHLMPPSAIVFAKYLEQAGYDLGNIKGVYICGTACSNDQLEEMRALYPNAKINSIYGSSETREAIMCTCEHGHQRQQELIMKAFPEFYYCEIVDPDTGEVIEEEGVYGELVLTTVAPDTPFPYVRYRTGDSVRRVAVDCDCFGEPFGYEVKGRHPSASIRITGGELKAASVEKALQAVADVRADYFEAYYSEQRHNDTLLPQLHVEVVPRGIECRTEAEVAQEVAANLPMAGAFTYADGIKKNFYAPLTVSFTEVKYGKNGKMRPPVLDRK